MNKKLLILLPAAALLLAGCNNSSEPSTSTSEPPTSTTVPEDMSKYGNQENPLTIAQFLANVDELVGKNDGEFSKHPFYILGKADAKALWASGSYQQFDTFYLKDNVTDSKGAKVQRTVAGTGVEKAPIYRNDTVLVTGYAEYYANGYSIFPYGSGDAQVLSVTRGKSTVTVTTDAHCSVDLATGTKTNGEILNVTATVDSGYKVHKFMVNNVEVKPNTSSVYSFTVEGPTEVVVTTIDASIVEEALPAGTYTYVLQKSNSGLPTGASSSATVVEHTIKEETGKLYSPLVATATEGVYNEATYNEFTLLKGKSLKLSINGAKITNVTLDAYKSVGSFVYNGDKVDATKKVSPVAGTPTANQDSTVFSYATNDSTVLIDCPSDASYKQSFYTITLTIVVE